MFEVNDALVKEKILPQVDKWVSNTNEILGWQFESH